jgi:arylsulfatase A-like enzyme
MYSREDVIPANRDAAELHTMHPVMKQYVGRPESGIFARQGVREAVIPAYMGLTSQIDTHVGRLLAFLEESGIADRTMVVFTSDHGDFLGDHWLSEKMAYFEEGVRVPMIVHDPRPEADATRGTVESRLVESIDLVPTFVEAAGGEPPSHILEGRSLSPLLRGEADADWRDFAICESENSFFLPFWDLDLTASEARSIMVRTDRWKYVHHFGLRPELYDLKSDPHERTDLGEAAEHEATRAGLHDMLFGFLARRKTRITMSDGEIEARTRRTLEFPKPQRYGQW